MNKGVGTFAKNGRVGVASMKRRNSSEREGGERKSCVRNQRMDVEEERGGIKKKKGVWGWWRLLVGQRTVLPEKNILF